MGWHDLGIIKKGKVVTPKYDLTKTFKPKTAQWGNQMVYRPTNYEGETYFKVDWKVKINHVKVNKRKNNFINNIIFTDCSTTIPGEPYSKKRHHLYGRVDPQNILFCTKLYDIYYKNYYATNISNYFWQGGINIDSDIHISDYSVKFKFYIMELWSANAAYTTARFSPYYKEINKYNNLLSELL